MSYSSATDPPPEPVTPQAPYSARAAAAVFAFVLAGMAVIASGAAWGMAARAENRASVVVSGAGASTSVTVNLQEFSVTPAVIRVVVGGSLAVQNVGTTPHDLVVDGHTSMSTPMLAPAGNAKLDLSGLAAGSYTVSCEVPGHRDAGMHAELVIVPAGAAATATAAGESSPASGMTGMAGGSNPVSGAAANMDEAMKTSTVAFPAKTAGLGGQPLAPIVLPDGTKQFDLTAQVVKWEVSAGKLVDAWTYNGTVPGPTLHVNVGDKVRVVLHNKLPESTVIHFHGLVVPNSMDGVPYITQPPIEPGADFVYSFTARGPAVGMYHSHFDATKQVGNGMAGAFLIGDEPLPAGVTVAQSEVMMLNDTGTIGLTLNGKSFPATAPTVAKLGDWIEVQYMNEGMMTHPMHLHGLTQLIIAKDGYPLAQPQPADTIPVAPGERYTVLVHADQLGTWAWHCHILSHAENDAGMFGMVTALIVK